MACCITKFFLILGGWGRGLHIDFYVIFMYISCNIQLPTEGTAVSESVTLFIVISCVFSGYLVNYKGTIHCFPAGETIIRLLLLLWTGDHPAQCEICKGKGAGGKKGCRRCHLIGMLLHQN